MQFNKIMMIFKLSIFVVAGIVIGLVALSQPISLEDKLYTILFIAFPFSFVGLISIKYLLKSSTPRIKKPSAIRSFLELPDVCPICGYSLNKENVHWIDDHKAECPSCGYVIDID